MDVLQVMGVHKSFGDNRVLKDISFNIKKSESVSILGESGCGKSTLAKILLGIETLDAGQIKLQGSPIEKLDYKGYRKIRTIIQGVFQDSSGSLNPKLSVYKNMEEGLKNLTSMSVEARKNEIYPLMERLGLSRNLLESHVINLSGGEKRRLSLIRALAVKPEILILDEVTSGLDKASKNRVMDLLSIYRRTTQCGILLITHDKEVAYQLSDKIILMEAGQIVKKAERKRKK